MKKGGRGKKPSKPKAKPRPSVVSKQLRSSTGSRVEYERVARRAGGHAKVYTVRSSSKKLTAQNVSATLKGLAPLSKAHKGQRVQIVLQRDGRSIGTLKYTSAGDLVGGRGWRKGFASWVGNTTYKSFSAIQVRVIE